ncbi:golvesin C-terminal-like domain-containing protein, partial [Cellvibrio sp.]
AMPAGYLSSNPNTPWVAGPATNDNYFRVKELFSSAYLNNLQVKFTRVICGNPQLHPVKNQLVPVAYIQGQKYFTIIPKQNDNSENNSAWVNGVQVTPTNSQPTNAVVTNWNFTVPSAGNYDVYVHWVSNKNQVANIAYAVDGQALKSASLDQNINAGIWTKLIKNTQYAAGEHSIKVSVDANGNYVVDGVRAEKTAQ